jgi:hypothetical protein
MVQQFADKYEYFLYETFHRRVLGAAVVAG